MAHISLVTLGVADVAEASAFYEALGFNRSSASQAEVSFFAAGPVVLSLFGRDALAADAGVRATGGVDGFSGISLAMNLPSEAAVDVEFGRWVAAGATSVKAPVAAFWGGYSCYVADLDGHLWELAHNPHIPVRPDGSMELPG